MPIVLDRPVGTQEGDLILAFCSGISSGSGGSGSGIPSTDGWIGMGPWVSGNFGGWGFKIAQNSDAANWTFTPRSAGTSGSSQGLAALIVYRGVGWPLPWLPADGAAPYASAAGNNAMVLSGAGFRTVSGQKIVPDLNPIYGSIGRGYPNSLVLVGVAHQSNDCTYSNPVNMTIRNQVHGVDGSGCLWEVVWDKTTDWAFKATRTIDQSVASDILDSHTMFCDDSDPPDDSKFYLRPWRNNFVPVEGD